MTEQINSITNLTDTDKTIEELLSEGYQGVNYELIENEGFVATANHFTDKIQWLKTSPDEDGDIGLMTSDIQAFDELLDFMLDKFGWCPMVYSNKSAPEIHIFTPENELEEMAIALTTDGEYGWKGSLYRLAYGSKYQDKIGLIFATKPEDSEQQDWLLVQIDQKNKERAWSVHNGTLEQVYYIMAEEIEIPEPNYNPTPEQISTAINSQTSEKIPIHLLEEEKVDEWNQWKFEHQEEELNLSEINLSSCNLSNANLQGANLSGADLSEADLSGANLSGVNLKDADLKYADLKYADLSGADLSNADLSGADLTDVDLTDVNIKGVTIDENTQINEGEFAFHQLVNDEIDIDSLSDEEAIKLHKQIAYYLLEENFDVENGYDSRYKLYELWVRIPDNKYKEYNEKIVFEGNYNSELITHIFDVFPYAYVRFYEECPGDFGGLQKLDLSFLSSVIPIIVEVFWAQCNGGELKNFGRYEIKGLASQIAFLIPEIPNLKGVAGRSKEDYAGDLKYILYYIVTAIVNTDEDISSCIVSEYNEYCRKDGKTWFQFIFEVADEINDNYVISAFESANVSRLDLSGIDLSNVSLSYVSLRDADLSNANLSDANLSDANLSGANLSGANLSDANLRDANLSGANLSGADLTDADLTDANLEGIITDENTKIEIPEE